MVNHDIDFMKYPPQLLTYQPQIINGHSRLSIILFGEMRRQLTRGIGVYELNSTFIYLYSLGAEIWFYRE
jgi:hypothetical protein